MRSISNRGWRIVGGAGGAARPFGLGHVATARLRHGRLRKHGLAATLGLCLAKLALVSACDRDDPFPTSPPIIPVSLPAVLGADVTGLGFDAVAINGSGQVAGPLNGRAVIWTPDRGTSVS